MVEINFNAIEQKWQRKWAEAKVFEVNENSKKPKYYVLEMFPYPSGSGLHMGHAWNYCIGDIIARMKRMQGFNVLHPMGYDALGLPAENAAIKAGVNPKEYTENSIKNYITQQKRLGLSYDWSRLLSSADASYYKWDQWIFLKMLEKGLAYQKESSVNWCPKCNSVLANEQVQDGKCWRHEDTAVEIKHLKQWFLKITDYADELYEGIDKLKDWPEKTKAMQKNWIGKSYGTEIDFKIETPAHKDCSLEPKKTIWPVFTTRPDTLCGVTFVVISAQHSKLFDIVSEDREKEVEKFLKKLKSVSEKELENLEKEGVFTGSYATNPINGEKVPVYAGNFVVADYGSGMVMAVPAHDQRDFEFAKKYNLPIKTVIRENSDTKIFFVDRSLVENWKEVLTKGHYKWILRKGGGVDVFIPDVNLEKFIPVAQSLMKNGAYYFSARGLSKIVGYKNKIFDIFVKDNNHLAKEFGRKLLISEKELDWSTAMVNEGKLINSSEFNGLDNQKAKEEITKFLIKKKIGRKKINFKLRDWGISRQRYWGTPIPIIHCSKCGAVPVAERDLPVELPKEVKFGKGNPLETNEKWLNVKCPKCGGKARREAETMDTFVNSSWYFLRYCDTKNNKRIFDKNKVDYWCPVDTYIGGAEHACMHLIYSRFYVKFLRDLGLLNFDEPCLRLFHQGMLHASDGEKMSKSKGNVVLPEKVADVYGIDTARFFLCGLASPDKDINWSEEGIQGSLKFIRKIIEYFENINFGKDSSELEFKLHLTIKNLTTYYDTFDYRKASIELRELFELIFEQKEINKKSLECALKLIAPICPHIAEELWYKLGNEEFISISSWPQFDVTKLKIKKQEIDLNEKYTDYIKEIIARVESKGKIIKKAYLYVVPFELSKINKLKVSKGISKELEIFSVKDDKKYDPENKSKKSIPGIPGIYLE